MSSAKECEKYLELLNRFIDGELDAEEEESLKAHLSGCERCRMELEKYGKLKALTESLKFAVPPDELWQEYPKDVLAQLERGIGKTILLVSFVLVVVYAAVALARAEGVPLPVRLALIGIGLGFAILLFSVYRQQRRQAKTDRYREIKK
jgi:anti-sigma factor RsiW